MLVLRYFPIDPGVAIRADHSDLLKVDWSIHFLAADFILPEDDNHALPVSFDAETIVRLLEEMPLSTERSPSDVEGLVPSHFAYRVEGATFFKVQSDTWKEVQGPIAHYEFVTGWACMDVLSRVPPTFKVVPTDRDAANERKKRWQGVRSE